MKFIRFFLHLLFLYPSLAPIICHAQDTKVASTGLTWDEKEIARVFPADEPGIFQFHAVNSTSEIVEIRSIKAGCGCMQVVASLEKIAPGAEFKVNISLNSAPTTSVEERQVLVTSSKATDVLKVRLQREAGFSLLPGVLVWETGETNGKPVRLKVDKDSEIKAISLILPNGAITDIDFTPTEKAQYFDTMIKPKSVPQDEVITALLKIETKEGQYFTRKLYLFNKKQNTP